MYTVHQQSFPWVCWQLRAVFAWKFDYRFLDLLGMFKDCLVQQKHYCVYLAFGYPQHDTDHIRK